MTDTQRLFASTKLAGRNPFNAPNQILLEVRGAIAAGSTPAHVHAMHLRWISATHPSLEPVTWTPEEQTHARRVLTRLARLTGEAPVERAQKPLVDRVDAGHAALARYEAQNAADPFHFPLTDHLYVALRDLLEPPATVLSAEQIAERIHRRMGIAGLTVRDQMRYRETLTLAVRAGVVATTR